MTCRFVRLRWRRRTKGALDRTRHWIVKCLGHLFLALSRWEMRQYVPLYHSHVWLPAFKKSQNVMFRLKFPHFWTFNLIWQSFWKSTALAFWKSDHPIHKGVTDYGLTNSRMGRARISRYHGNTNSRALHSIIPSVRSPLVLYETGSDILLLPLSCIKCSDFHNSWKFHLRQTKGISAHPSTLID